MFKDTLIPFRNHRNLANNARLRPLSKYFHAIKYSLPDNARGRGHFLSLGEHDACRLYLKSLHLVCTYMQEAK